MEENRNMCENMEKWMDGWLAGWMDWDGLSVWSVCVCVCVCVIDQGILSNRKEMYENRGRVRVPV